ncbi:hypothetical protein B5807_01121 [Epicoccum nigrum]|uniref:Uncharacterized protein n=1 Tax=Epicoccum nigrum TaxID=105696 RepID=A0A1Y2MGF9_EPING|nr:hypothetical protein B5807_01121 [Epicoccum nigrum]
MFFWSEGFRNRHTCTRKFRNGLRTMVLKQFDLPMLGLLNMCSWSAVIRGAVVFSLQGNTNTVTQRKNRRHYGVGTSRKFDPKKHDEIDAFIDEYDGVKRAAYQMDWLLKQGKDLPTSGAAHAILDMFDGFWPNEKRVTQLALRASNNVKAPKTSTHKDVFVVTEITVDLSSVPDDEFETHRSPSGSLYHRLEYKIELTIQASMELSL